MIAKQINGERNNSLGNPFKAKDSSKEEAIGMFGIYLNQAIHRNELTSPQRKLLNHIWRLAKQGDVTLVCHCHPKSCHAEVIKRIVEERL